MSKNLSWRKLLGVVIITLCLLFLLVQSNLYSPSFPNTSWEGATLSIVAGGGIVLGSYLMLGPVGVLVSLVALSAGGCVADGGDEKDLGEPPNPPD